MKHNSSLFRFTTALLLAWVISLISNAEVISWTASSGLTPDQIGYDLVDNASPENPALNNSILTLSTSSSSELMYYNMSKPSTPLYFPAVFEASFRMRQVSGSSSYAGRRAAAVTVTTGPNIGSNLFIGDDIIFLSENFVTQGPAASLDTNDSFHDYILRITGSDVSVFQDGNLVLTGSTINTDGYASDLRVTFGDITTLERGTSEWESFSHNAMIPEPAVVPLLASSCLTLLYIKRLFFS